MRAKPSESDGIAPRTHGANTLFAGLLGRIPGKSAP
jgi:hypothetical protein